MQKLMGGSQQSSASGIGGSMGLEGLLGGLQDQQGGTPQASSGGMGLKDLLESLQGQQGDVPAAIEGMGLEDLLQGHQADVPAASGTGMNLSELMQSLQSGQSSQYIESSGAYDELAQQTGLDPDPQVQTLQGTLGALLGRGGRRLRLSSRLR